MDIAFDVLGQVIVDDHLQALDVKAPGGHVRRDEKREPAGGEVVDDPQPFVLGQVPRQKTASITVLFELFGQPLGGVAGVGEDQGVFRRFGLDEPQEKVGLEMAADPIKLLGDRLDRDPLGRQLDEHGIVEKFHRGPPGQPVQGGAEEKALPPAGRRELPDDPLDVGKKSHVEQAVGLVDHQDTDVAQAQRSFLLEVEKAARRADQDVGPLAEDGLLLLITDAAVKTADGETEAPVQQIGFALDLDGQLPGRGDDQSFPAFPGSVPQQAVENRHQEGRGLSRARLGLDGRVTAGEGLGQRPGLDVGCLGIPPVRDRAEEPGIQAQFVKTH